MDQFVASFGAAGHALMPDCRSFEYQLLPIPEDLRLVVCNSMVRHELASGEYNLRRPDCETGVKLLHAHLPGVKALRDIEIQDLERCEHALPVQVYRRCRHVVTENRRAPESGERAGDEGRRAVWPTDAPIPCQPARGLRSELQKNSIYWSNWLLIERECMARG